MILAAAGVGFLFLLPSPAGNVHLHTFTVLEESIISFQFHTYVLFTYFFYL